MRLATVFLILAASTATQLATAAPPPAPMRVASSVPAVSQVSAAPTSKPTSPKPQPDLSGSKRVGIASFYADNFAGRQMADGTIMDPQGDNAASRTLPLGTTAKVTNIETGKSAIVTIQDRGPYVDGRIVDLSPGTAEKIGITRRQGLSKVVVAPIAVPLPNGDVKAGVAVKEVAPDLAEPPRTKISTASPPCQKPCGMLKSERFN